MIPNVFVSSTIQDLHHLREAVRDTLLEMALNPVLSEFGDVGFLPSASAAESCYVTMRQCQLAVIIVGKRYGSLADGGLSVTHNECVTARSGKVPTVCLVDHDVLSFKRIYDANRATGPVTFPGMDHPEQTFRFVQEISDSPVNNGILPFATAADVRAHLKKQLAHLFGELLRSSVDPARAEMVDVLSEIKTLRQEISGKISAGESERYLQAVRFLLDDKAEPLREIATDFVGRSLDSVIPPLIASQSLEMFVEEMTGNPPELVSAVDFGSILRSSPHDFIQTQVFMVSDPRDTEKQLVGFLGRKQDGSIAWNVVARDQAQQIYQQFRAALDGVPAGVFQPPISDRKRTRRR